MAILKIVLAACGFFLLATGAKAQTSFEYELKAAFLFRFTEFVDWPAGAFASREAPLRICIVGPDPFGDALDEALRGQRVRGREVVAMRADAQNPLSACHVVFIGRSEQDRVQTVLTQLRGKPVLTVGDIPGFLDIGGTINFVSEGSRIRFDINLEAAERARLQMSSKLLRLARIVRRERRVG